VYTKREDNAWGRRKDEKSAKRIEGRPKGPNEKIRHEGGGGGFTREKSHKLTVSRIRIEIKIITANGSVSGKNLLHEVGAHHKKTNTTWETLKTVGKYQ